MYNSHITGLVHARFRFENNCFFILIYGDGIGLSLDTPWEIDTFVHMYCTVCNIVAHCFCTILGIALDRYPYVYIVTSCRTAVLFNLDFYRSRRNRTNYP